MEQNPIDKKVEDIKTVITTSKTLNGLARMVAIVFLIVGGVVCYTAAVENAAIIPLSLSLNIGIGGGVVLLSAFIIVSLKEKKEELEGEQKPDQQENE